LPVARNLWFWLILLLGHFSLLPWAQAWAAWVICNSTLISESYLLGIAISLHTLTALLPAYEGLRSGTVGPAAAVGTCIFFGLMAGAIGLMKISIVVLLVVIGAYMLVRGRLYRSWQFCLLAGLSFLSGALAVWLTYNPFYNAVLNFRLFGCMHALVKPQWWPYHHLLLYMWLLVYFGWRLVQERVFTRVRLWGSLRNGQLLDCELLLLLTVVAVTPGLVMGYNSHFFFADYPRWLGLAMLLSLVAGRPDGQLFPRALVGLRNPILSPARLGATLAQLLLGVGAIAHLVSSARSAGEAMVSTVTPLRHLDIGRLERDVLNGRFAAAYRVCRENGLFIESWQHQEREILQVLKALGQLPLAEKRQTALYIPSGNRRYWDFWPGPGKLPSTVELAVAVSGLSMVHGIPEDFPLRKVGYGMACYPEVRRLLEPGHAPQQYTEETAAERAAAWGFSRLIVLQCTPEGKIEVRRTTLPTPASSPSGIR
jgi:hypothetical protein